MRTALCRIGFIGLRYISLQLMSLDGFVHELRRIRADAPRTSIPDGGEFESEVDAWKRSERRFRIVRSRCCNPQFVGTENSIRIDVLVVSHIERRDGFAVPRCADQEVYVSRTPAMPTLCADHVAHRTVHWNLVSRGFDSPEMIQAGLIAVEAAAKFHFTRVQLLQIVEAVFVGLPD